MEYKVIGISLFLLALFTAIGALAGFLLFGLPGLLFFGAALFLLSLLLVSIALLHSPSMILSKYGAKPSENRKLNEAVERMAVNAKIPIPKVYVLPMEVPNSFAVGRGKGNAAVCVTEGLLTLNEGEIESVVAHEVWHIANDDIIVQEFVSVLAAIFRLTVVLLPLAVFIVRLGLSERIEYRADYYAVRLAKKPRDLASALSKMSETARQNPMRGSPAYESIWAINPFRREGTRRWFYVHAPTARRRKRVEDMAHEGIPESYEGTEAID